MNPCGAQPSAGTLLLREDPLTPGVFVAMSGITEMPDYNASAETGECGGFDVTGAGYKQKYKNGVFDQDDWSLVLDYKSQDAEQLKLKDDFDSLASINYRIQLPDANATKLTVPVNVINWGFSIPVGENIQRNITLQPTGDPVWTE